MLLPIFRPTYLSICLLAGLLCRPLPLLFFQKQPTFPVSLFRLVVVLMARVAAELTPGADELAKGISYGNLFSLGNAVGVRACFWMCHLPTHP